MADTEVDPLEQIEEELEDAALDGVNLFTAQAEAVTERVAKYLEETEPKIEPVPEHIRNESEDTVELLKQVIQDDKAQQLKKQKPDSEVEQTGLSFAMTGTSVVNRIKSPDHHSFTSQRETADMRAHLETLEQRLSQMEILIDRLLGSQKAINPKLTAHDADITNLVSSMQEMITLIISNRQLHHNLHRQSNCN